MKHRGELILRMEDTVTLEAEVADSHDFNIPKDHGHVARNCLIKITTLAMKALVISLSCVSLNYSSTELSVATQLSTM